ncbi:nitroreductase family protein [Gulosibacter sediminis]|uniref:nitroreductase family protein n=1 Tax=Gulosibacter sediminis TaxID=1729695 RepID=UPI001867C8C0|nr:nitroreductase family protein [Gulosibacter sediminis]
MLKKLKSTVKNVLANPQVRAVYNGTNRAVLAVAASNRLTATLYSTVGFATFNREQYAVLRGRSHYYRDINRPQRNNVGLRRNIHRLEKGMVMQPRRDVFALDYLGETIEFLEGALSRRSGAVRVDPNEIAWAKDVLTAYFGMVDLSNPVIAEAKERFENVIGTLDPVEGIDEQPTDRAVTDVVSRSPFLAGQRTEPGVTYDQMLNLATHRRSVRWFEQREVPTELVDKALAVARQSPTACNREPYEFKVFTDPAMAREVAGIPFGTGGYSEQVPAIAVVVGKLENYFSPRDRHAIYVDSSLAAMSFIYGLETLGLSSTIINWPDFEPLEIQMQKALGLDASERVIMLIAFGYADPDGGVPFSQKKSIDSIRSINAKK